MTGLDDFLKVEPKRDFWGRYLIVPKGGGKPTGYTRATTLAETLDDRFNLELWKQRMAMKGTVLSKSIFAQAASLPLPQRGDGNWMKWKKLGEKAIDRAKEDDAADLGEALHRFTERLNRGENIKVPEPWDKDIEAYYTTLAAHGFEIDRDHIENTVVLESIGVAGTFDLLLSGKIADLKTGQDLELAMPAICIQLAIYSRGETLYDHRTETHTPMPPVDQDTAIVIHLPAGKATCTLYEVDLNAGWEAAQMALWVRGWRKRKDLAKACTPGSTTSSPSAAPATAPSMEQTPSTTPSAPSSTPILPRQSKKTDWRSSTSKPGSATKPDEGGDADPAAVAALRARYEAMVLPCREWMNGVLSQAKKAGTSLNLSVNATVRRFEIGRALVTWAEMMDQETTPIFDSALGLALGEEVQPAVPLGAAVSALTIEEARKLCGIAEALNAGEYAVIFADDGSVRIEAA